MRYRSRFPGGRLLLLSLVLLGLAGSLPARAEIASWLAFDLESGHVLEQRNAFRQWHPASLTKLMTAYVTFDAIRAGRLSLNSPVVVSARALAEPPSKMGFKVGTELTVDNALKMVLVKSANDIAVALGEAVGGSVENFARLMNAQAARLGMRDSHFTNPNGLPDRAQVVTAHDLALLARALLNEFPQYREYYSYSGIRFGKKTLKSANREFLLRVRGANGLKTGYICDSGYNVAVSAKRGGRTIIAIVLGAASGLERAAAASHLVEKGFATGTGFFSRRKTIDQLARPARPRAVPPAGYCKRAKEPDVDELIARYAGRGGAGRRSTPALAYATGDSGRIIPAARSAAVPETPKKSNGKVDWAKVLNILIGNRLHEYDPVPVTTGVPKGAKRPQPLMVKLAPLQDGVKDALGDAPLPTPKPRFAAAAAAPAVAPAAAAAPRAQPKPGSIVVLPPRAADGTRTPLVRPAR